MRTLLTISFSKSAGHAHMYTSIRTVKHTVINCSLTMSGVFCLQIPQLIRYISTLCSPLSSVTRYRKIVSTDIVQQ